MTTGRWILAAIILLAVGLATAQGLRPHPPPPVEVTTAIVKRQDVTRTVSAAGHLQARETVKVSSNVTGELLSLAVKEGDHVKRGQVLGQIDKRLQESQVAQYRGAVASAVAQAAQVEATLAQDRRDVERLQKLAAENLASAADLEKAQTQLKLDESRLTAQRQIIAQQQGQLETALYSLSRATLTAPIDGTILELNHKVGERIRGSDFSEDVVLLMGGLAEMEVKAEVGEHEVVGIHVGDEATIEIDAMPDKQFDGHVVAVGRNAQIKNPGTDAEVTTFFIRIGLDSPPEGGLPGLSASVSIATAKRSGVLTVPIQAVTSREPKKDDKAGGAAEAAGDAGAEGAARPVAGGKPKPQKVVFVVKDGKAEMRAVRTGIASRTHVEILDGLAEGETVVDGPYRTLARELQDGQAVKVRVEGEGDGGAEPRGGS
ncbi:MAG: efflux RND transporter periplasmic adaptor subunit [Polyangiaceae bacterium]|nr:efflux RND transporter periplasmic adaptor subunit [Polyangiaceae bacterium]